MCVRVRFNGILRFMMGQEIMVSVFDGQSVGSVLEMVEQEALLRGKEIPPVLRNGVSLFKVLLNNEEVDLEQTVQSGDEIFLLSPIGGG